MSLNFIHRIENVFFYKYCNGWNKKMTPWSRVYVFRKYNLPLCAPKYWHLNISVQWRGKWLWHTHTQVLHVILGTRAWVMRTIMQESLSLKLYHIWSCDFCFGKITLILNHKLRISTTSVLLLQNWSKSFMKWKTAESHLKMF